MQSTNVGDDKLLLDKFAERGITASTVPLIGGGGHWTVPELVKVAGKEHLEGMIVGLANWPGRDIADMEKRFVARTREPWFGHDSIFPYAHVMIFKEALEQTKSTDRKKVGETLHQIDLKDGPAQLFPDGRDQVRRERPPARRRALHRAVAEGPPGGGAPGEHRGLEGGLAEVVAGCGHIRRMRKKVQMRGGARRPHARRSLSGSLALAGIPASARLAFGFGSQDVSVRPRAPTKQMGLFPHPARNSP